ncbi:golgin subfamily a member 3 [Limosa lapponica baueri]|uniref:Golgin subfamily a member 3 n=1 Tax=Limosa lapponica baueri TaxID=1758121 RepID=A0A2I0U9M3_LIMLA|nr:golgin subfamily a member 3 [Limosa lapponica baueri]
MDSSSVQQDVHVENRNSNGAPTSSEELLDCKAKSDLPVTTDEINTTSIDINEVPNEEGSLEINSKVDACQNGPESLFPDSPVSFDPTSSAQGQESSPGVTGFHDSLRKSQGTSAEGIVLRKEALQSLKLSLPMQETELCSVESSLPLEKEEQIRLQARRRLEEQLKQYRVKRHQERSNQSTSKSRPSSTLDPELMLNPEILPRASTVAMTKEYSFLRTSVPRGPKLGSLGLPASSKERRSSKSKPSKIRSLADYRTEDSGSRNAPGNFVATDLSGGTLKQSRSGPASVVSEISLPSDMDDRIENSSVAGDSVSEIDGSEVGMRLDGNESDSSIYSSVSGKGLYNSLQNVEGKQGIPYTINGQKIHPDAMGQFPSISEVLQAAAVEHQAQEQEVNGEVRSRRDSISSSVSMESSIAGTHDEMLQVLKEKMRLEGQLEALSLEANQALKEKTELQAQLAALNMKLQAQMEHSQNSQQKQESLSSEVATLKQSCWDLERAMADLQSTLEAKNASLASSNNDLQLAEEQYQRLLLKVEDMQKNVLTRDSTVHDLRQQLASLQNQLQKVQLERTTLTNKLKASETEITSLQNVRQWYQQQLVLAQEARVRLQSEMANIQAGQMTQAGMLEHLKLENVALSQQLTETQHRSIKEKERIAAQLQNIEVKLTLHQRDLQLESLQQEHLDLMKQFTLTQETLHTKEQSLDDLQTQYDELKARLEEFQSDATSKDDTIQYLQNEKIVLEVALQAAKASKEQLDEGAMRLGEGAEVASEILEQLRQEMAIKAITEQKQKMKRLGSDLTSAQKEMKAKHKAYENAVGILSRRLQESLAAKESAEAELSKLKAQITDGGNNQIAQERIQALETELQAVSSSKLMLEKELQEVISLTSQELEEYREKVLELEDELQESRGFRRKIKRLEEINKKLALELEHERGKLTGLSQSNAALREHNNILETALAKREADLVQLNLQVQAVLKRKEEEDQQMQQLIQALQDSLEKEKSKVRELKKQEAAAKADAAHNRRHYKAAALELSEIKKELHAKELLVQALQAEVDKLQVEDEKHSQEVSQFQQELAEARSQLQLLQKKLDDKLTEQPVVSQEVEDLKWEVEQKEREIETLKQQLDMSEQRSHKELEGIQVVLQNIKAELEMVREDLSVTQKDKFMLQAKVTELKNSMKSLLQQNQQLKLDLKHGKMKKRKELKGENNSSNPVTPVKIPDCPVPAALLEELLKPSTAVSKEPLKNLNSCLRQLKQEMDSLQRQMEEHTITVHESMSSWTQIEGQLMDLTSTSPATASDQQEIPTADEKKQNCSVSDKEALTL